MVTDSAAVTAKTTASSIHNGMGTSAPLVTMPVGDTRTVRALQVKPGDAQACANARRAASELGAAPQELGGCRAQAG